MIFFIGLPALAIPTLILSPVEISRSAVILKASLARAIARSIVKTGLSAPSESVKWPT